MELLAISGTCCRAAADPARLRRSCSACSSSCTSSATTSRRAGAGCRSRRFSIGFGRAVAAWHRPARHRMAARLAAARRLREAARPGDARGRDAPRRAPRWRAGRDLPRQAGRQPRHRRRRRAGRQFPARRPCCSPGSSRPSASRSAPPAVGAVVAGSAAARAGLQAGDRIVALDGQPVSRFERGAAHTSSRAPASRCACGRPRDGDGADADRHRRRRTARGRAPTAPVGVLGIQRRRGAASSGWTRSRRSGGGVGADRRRHRPDPDGHRQMITGERGTEELGGPLRIAAALRRGRRARHRQR